MCSTFMTRQAVQAVNLKQENESETKCKSDWRLQLLQVLSYSLGSQYSSWFLVYLFSKSNTQDKQSIFILIISRHGE